MAKKVLNYMKFTSNKTPYDIALKWFSHFMKKNMAVALTKYESGDHTYFNVWVEVDPVFYGDHVVDRKLRKEPIHGDYLLSWGGFKERFNTETGMLNQRIDYTNVPHCPACGCSNMMFMKDGPEKYLACSKCGFKTQGGGIYASSKAQKQL